MCLYAPWPREAGRCAPPSANHRATTMCPSRCPPCGSTQSTRCARTRGAWSPRTARSKAIHGEAARKGSALHAGRSGCGARAGTVPVDAARERGRWQRRESRDRSQGARAGAVTVARERGATAARERGIAAAARAGRATAARERGYKLWRTMRTAIRAELLRRHTYQ